MNPDFAPAPATNGKTLSALAMALACAAFAPTALSAQSSPGGFQLPEATPTPTQVPQGPVDERAGVPIAPRVTPENRPTPEPTPTPTPPPTERATESPPAASEPATQTNTPSQSTGTSSAPTETAREPSAGSAPPRPSQPATPARIDNTEPADDAASEPAIGPDDWYDVDQLGTESNTPLAVPDAGSDTGAGSAASSWAEQASALTETRNLAISGVMIVLLLIGGLWVWRRRKSATEPLGLPAPALAAGVRKSIAATQPATKTTLAPSPSTEPLELETIAEPAPELDQTPDLAPAAPAEAKAPEPLKVDVSLHIENASRSVMMFMVDYRLTIANRSDKAARDIEVYAGLTCAQRGSANAAPAVSGRPGGTIDRIGPHQSRSLANQLQMPLTEVQAIRQGQKPLFIPLLHLTIVSAGGHTLTRSFVVGEPSTTSQGRVHPIRLDTPPGGLPGLQAREVSLETA
ncbi:MAG: hypothetical protein AAFQ27_07465 [Pseudomonadota bacterium]